MKQLKLSTIGLTFESRKILIDFSRCLIGSVSSETWRESDNHIFCGITESVKYPFIVHHSKSGNIDNCYKYDYLLLPLETLKVNPWRCAEFGVSVSCDEDAADEIPHVVGIITSISDTDHNVGGRRTLFCVDDFEYYVQDISLDLDNLPKGCEVVDD